MANAETAKRIEAPAERVWALLSGAEMIEEIVPGIYGEKAEFDRPGRGAKEAGAGAILTTTLKDGKGIIRERIEEVNDEERCLKYRVLDVGPFPYANYQGEIRVTFSGTDACIVSFQCSYVPVGVPEDESRLVWLENNNNVLEGINKYLTQ